jgi:phosphatidylserine/phosphatidylglycerophosphate/cardiolipin synthase-like enzyme
VNSIAISSLLTGLKESLINETPLASPPLLVNSANQKLHFFLHPEHGKISLNEIIRRIDKATHRVFVAMYTFTHPDLLQTLCVAKKRGVDVRVIFDRDSSLQTSKKAYAFCKKEHITCGFRSKTGLLHYKTAIIDNTLVTGSCNWTKAGFLSNNEAILIIDPLSASQEKWISRWWAEIEKISTISTQKGPDGRVTRSPSRCSACQGR